MGEYRDDRGEDRHRQSPAVDRQGLDESGERLADREMQQCDRRRYQGRQCREAHRPKAADHWRAAGDIKRVGNAGPEHQCTTDQHAAGIAQTEIVDERETDAGIAKRNGNDLSARKGFALKKYADEDGQRRVGEEDQSLQAGGDVLQSHEVENAGAVVTEAAEDDKLCPVVSCQVRSGSVSGQTDPEKEGQGEAHAQGKQGDGIDAIGVGKLDENGFQRKTQRPDQGEANAISVRFFQSDSRWVGVDAIRNPILRGYNCDCSN